MEPTTFEIYAPVRNTINKALGVVVKVAGENITVQPLAGERMTFKSQYLAPATEAETAALREELVYDEAGQLLSRTFMEYALPTAADVPEPVLAHLETPSPKTPGGFKGMSEGGTVAPPAAIANAVADALAGAGIDGGAIDFYPLTPPRLFALLRKRAASAMFPPSP